MNSTYDCAIIGGGLSGLAAAIQLSKKGHLVVLLEKNFYPFHKVCGEYISMESWKFLEELGLPLKEINPPIINRFGLTHPKGKQLDVKLPLGGFGLSRYFLDDQLSTLAVQNGVIVLQGTAAERISFDSKVQEHIIYNQYGEIHAKTAIGAYGKRSKLDKKLRRPSTSGFKRPEDNYVGIKYHVKSDIEPDRIELHLFEGGYAGMSRVEDDKTCFCYLVNSKVLKRYNGDIDKVEEKVLGRNPFLQDRMRAMTKLFTEPLTISQIEFGEKEQVFNHILMAGDTAGMITPLTGNGMSLGMHASKLVAESIDMFLQGKTNQKKLEKSYERQWEKRFGARVRRGRTFQKWFLNEEFSGKLIGALRHFPPIAKAIIKSSHGKPY